MLVKVSADEIFMQYFRLISSFWGFRARWGFRLLDPLVCPLVEKNPAGAHDEEMCNIPEFGKIVC